MQRLPSAHDNDAHQDMNWDQADTGDDDIILLAPGEGGGGAAAVAVGSGEEWVCACLDRIGNGYYQLLVTCLCGVANAADAVELMSISFLISSTAECDLELTEVRKALLTSS